jgi:transposase
LYFAFADEERIQEKFSCGCESKNKEEMKVSFCAGIDIAKDKFDVCIKERKSDGRSVVKGSRSFSNAEAGFEELGVWIEKRTREVSTLLFVMEATGVYYENLAYWLEEHGFNVSVEPANKVKHYARSLSVKTKTDKVDASVLASMGLERELVLWHPMSVVYRELRDVSRSKLAYRRNLNALKSQLSAMESAHDKYDMVLSLQKEQIAFYEDALDKLDVELKEIARRDPELYERINKVCTIKGLQFNTVVAVICETNGFRLFHSIKQVVSYSGLDVKFNESGKRKGRTTISKKGNARIREVLYMPALSAIQHNKPIAQLHKRICEKNPTARKKGVTAGMRKLLVLIYTLWKKNEEYIENYVVTGTVQTSGNEEN